PISSAMRWRRSSSPAGKARSTRLRCSARCPAPRPPNRPFQCPIPRPLMTSASTPFDQESNMSETIGKSFAALAIVLAAGASAAVAQTAGGGHAAPAAKGQISKLPAAPELEWPLPPGVDRKYDAIDGKRMKGYVEELAAMARKSRDAG